MGKITEYPEVTGLADADKLFVNVGGNLKQIKKENCDFGGGSDTHSKILKVFDNNSGNGWRGDSGSMVDISSTHSFNITRNGTYIVKIHITKAQGVSSGSGQFRGLIDGNEINSTNDSRQGRGTVQLSNLSSSYSETVNFVDLTVGTHTIKVDLGIIGSSSFYVGGTTIEIYSFI